MRMPQRLALSALGMAGCTLAGAEAACRLAGNNNREVFEGCETRGISNCCAHKFVLLLLLLPHN